MTCCESNSKRYDFPDHYAGTTVAPRSVTVRRNDLPETDMTVLIEFKDRDGTVVETSQPSVSNEGVFIIPAMVFANPGKYTYQVKFTYPDTTVKIYMFGEIKIV